jgi:very-short-patch-repair endonuclease
VERTLIDLAGSISNQDLEVALDSALRMRKTTIPRLKWCVSNNRRKGVKGIGVLDALLTERSLASESPLETRLAQILRQSSLPMPEAQFRVMDGAKVIGRFDFAYPAAKLIIEVDGYRWHSGKHAWQKDRERDNALNRLGWTVLRFTAEDLRRPRLVISQIRDVLYPRLDSGVR